jgi:tetratricopeptide (TPR) repeat protein
MPTTEFARMTRSDHSMRPPTPATTIKYKSPNACNLCHDDKDAKWSDEYVRQWFADDYQKPVLELAALIDEARKSNWKRLDEILAYIAGTNRDEVFASSFIRLLRNCESQKKWPTIIKALEKDPSPLVRGSAAQALDNYVTSESMQPLLKATQDEYRLVRVNAAASLAEVLPEHVDPPYDKSLKAATAEYISAMHSREDDYVSHYNLGNFHMARQDGRAARDSFERAIELRPDFIPPYINVAFVYNALGLNDKAEAAFKKAVELEPKNLPAHLNLGMLLGEMNRPRDAEKTFRKALEIDPNCATAAYNLGVLIAAEKPDESLHWCRKACELQPDNPHYGYTYAFYLCHTGKTQQGIRILQAMVDQKAAYLDAYMLLGATLEQQGKPQEAADVYRRGYQNEHLSQRERQALAIRLQQLSR